MLELYTSQQETIRLGKQLGRGGEGSVYEVLEHKDLVAKIYHEAISSEKAEKLRRMAGLKNDRLLRLTAWVTDVLHRKSDDSVVGFVMPKISSGTAIHELYNPKSRRELFPAADWRFLINAATNLARAFAVIHAHEHAIGDVNHGNVVIAKDSTVRLIDCDSYHLNAPERSFLCEVGVSTHTPPELQGKSLRGITRTASHDAFGLAVLVFQLLFMGRHPFSGNFLGKEDNSLESAISEFRFAYGAGAATRQMQQPPGTLPLSAVSLQAVELFERAFLTVENRPTAREWIEALEGLSQNLRRCEANELHYYLQTLDKCPWCNLEKQAGVLYFTARQTNSLGNNSEFDLITIGGLIDSIKLPNPRNNLPVATQNHLRTQIQPFAHHISQFSPTVKAALRYYNIKLTAFLIGVGSIVFFSIIFGFDYFLQLGLVCYWLCSGIFKSIINDAQQNAQQEVDQARQKWANFKEEWHQQTALKTFEVTRDKLKADFRNFQNLPKFRETKLKEIEAKNRQKQLEIFLNDVLIDEAQIFGLEEERVRMLKRNNVKTAADITKQNVADLPNFDFSYKKQLFNWRATLEKQFVYEPTLAQRKEDLREVENQISLFRRRLEDAFRSNFPQLQSLALQINKRHCDLTVQSELFAAELSQAENDLQKVSNLYYTAIVWTICVVIISFILGVAVNLSTFSNASRSHTAPVPVFDQTTIKAVRSSTDAASSNGSSQLLPHEKGEKNFANGKYEEAAVNFREAIKLNPQIAELHIELGDALFQTKYFNEAIDEYNRALNLMPDDPSEAWYKLGKAYEKLGFNAKAQKAFEDAVKSNPNGKSISEPLKILAQPRPAYTEDARNQSVQGVVRLRVTFSDRGNITEVTSINGLPYGLTEQAIAAARQMKFTPAKKSGLPVSVSKVVEYTFTLY